MTTLRESGWDQPLVSILPWIGIFFFASSLADHDSPRFPIPGLLPCSQQAKNIHALG